MPFPRRLPFINRQDDLIIILVGERLLVEEDLASLVFHEGTVASARSLPGLPEYMYMQTSRYHPSQFSSRQK